jgi:hypothetical protein
MCKRRWLPIRGIRRKRLFPQRHQLLKKWLFLKKRLFMKKCLWRLSLRKLRKRKSLHPSLRLYQYKQIPRRRLPRLLRLLRLPRLRHPQGLPLPLHLPNRRHNLWQGRCGPLCSRPVLWASLLLAIRQPHPKRRSQGEHPGSLMASMRILCRQAKDLMAAP